MKVLKILLLCSLFIGSSTLSIVAQKGQIQNAMLNGVAILKTDSVIAAGDIWNLYTAHHNIEPLIEGTFGTNPWYTIGFSLFSVIEAYRLNGIATHYDSANRINNVWIAGGITTPFWTQNLILRRLAASPIWNFEQCDNLGAVAQGGAPVNLLNSISIGKDGDGWAVGSYSSTEQASQPSALHHKKYIWTYDIPITAPANFFGAVNAQLKSVSVVDTNNRWAVGLNYNYVTDPATGIATSYSSELIEKGDATSWKVENSASNPQHNSRFLNGVYAIDSNNVWAVGAESGATGSVTLIEHREGTAWTKTAFSVSGQLNSVYAFSASDVWAVGTGNTNSTSWVGALTLHYDGKKWVVIKNAFLKLTTCTLNSVSGDAANNVWAIGSHNKFAISEHWNGRKWKAVPTK